MRTQDLIGAQLDWAVAKAEGDLYPQGDVMVLEGKLFSIEPGDYETSDRWRKYSPSTDWNLAGPIIEQEGIGLMPSGTAYFERNGGTFYSYGPTPLVAAMRCFCVSRLGDEINIPEELL